MFWSLSYVPPWSQSAARWYLPVATSSPASLFTPVFGQSSFTRPLRMSKVAQDAGREWSARRRRRVRPTELHQARRPHGRLHPIPGQSECHGMSIGATPFPSPLMKRGSKFSTSRNNAPPKKRFFERETTDEMPSMFSHLPAFVALVRCRRHGVCNPNPLVLSSSRSLLVVPENTRG